MQELKLCWIEMLVEITTKNLCKVVYIAVTKTWLCLKIAAYPTLYRKQRMQRVWSTFTLEQSDRLAIQKNPFTEEGHLLGCHGIFQEADQEAA